MRTQPVKAAGTAVILMGSTDEMLATVADTEENLAMRDAVENDLDLPDDADVAPEHRGEYQDLIEKVEGARGGVRSLVQGCHGGLRG